MRLKLKNRVLLPKELQHYKFQIFFIILIAMDEVTVINLLNKICEKNPALSWKLKCKFDDGMEVSIMEISIFKREEGKKSGNIVFSMDIGKILSGKYKSLYPFTKNTPLVDALLEILHYETRKLSITIN